MQALETLLLSFIVSDGWYSSLEEEKNQGVGVKTKFYKRKSYNLICKKKKRKKIIKNFPCAK